MIYVLKKKINQLKNKIHFPCISKVDEELLKSDIQTSSIYRYLYNEDLSHYNIFIFFITINPCIIIHYVVNVF